jgi:hypothetical protein
LYKYAVAKDAFVNGLGKARADAGEKVTVVECTKKLSNIKGTGL